MYICVCVWLNLYANLMQDEKVPLLQNSEDAEAGAISDKEQHISQSDISQKSDPNDSEKSDASIDEDLLSKSAQDVRREHYLRHNRYDGTFWVTEDTGPPFTNMVQL